MLVQKTLLIFLAAAGFLLLPHVVHAQETRLFLDAATVRKGYTVFSSDKKFLAAFFGGVLRKPTTVMVRRFGEEESASLFARLTPEKKPASAIYSFDTNLPASAVRGVVRVGLKGTAAVSSGSAMVFYDTNQERWREIATRRNAQGTFIASIPFPFATVALVQRRDWVEDDMVHTSLVPVRSVAVLNGQGEVIFEKNESEQLPVASLTKLMTALVFLEHNPGWETPVEMEKNDDTEPARLALRTGEKVLVKDLFMSMLVGSKNNAAHALARSTGLSRESFVARMNVKAVELGATKTVFVDPSGLDEYNISTSADYARLAAAAFKNETIRKAAVLKNYTFTTQNTRRRFSVGTTNPLLYGKLPVTGGKTGFTNEGGYTMALQGREQEREAIVLVLGAPSSATRFAVSKRLLSLALNGNIRHD